MPDFDAFISYNSEDRDAVVRLAEALRAANLKVWLDVWELRPGEPWQPALERAVASSRSAVVAVGKSGAGPWQQVETRAALMLVARDQRPVIPVLLPDSPERVELPLFLSQNTWVDLREGYAAPGLDRLLWGITGQKPRDVGPTIGDVSVKTRARLEDVFRTSGLPNYTYVEPSIYQRVARDFRQSAKHVLLSGPSGSGKTCLVFRLLEEMEFKRDQDYLYISSLDERAASDVHEVLIKAIKGHESRLVIVDDFHLLPKDLRLTLGAGLKQLADEAFGRQRVSTFVLLGIPSSGESLLLNASDLGPRLGLYQMPVATDGDLSRLLRRGEERLGIEFVNRDGLAREASGSYYICQYLAQEICMDHQVSEAEEGLRQLSFDMTVVRTHLVSELETRFRPHVVAFVKNSGTTAYDRFPFAVVLALIAAIPRPTITCDDLLDQSGQFKAAITSVKPRISSVIASSLEAGRFGRYIYFDEDADVFSIEDPIFRYFLTFHDLGKVFERCGLTTAHQADVMQLFSDVRSRYGRQVQVPTHEFVRDSVFVCYSHADRKWLETLQMALKPLLRERVLDLWADTRIEPGQRWREEIAKAIKRAKVAILLVSQAFLASDFIAQEELGPLLESAAHDGLRVLWIPIGFSTYEMTKLAQYQAASNPARPLESLPPQRRNRELVEIAKRVQEALDRPNGTV